MSYMIKYSDVAYTSWKKHVECHDISHYTGILSMHALAQLSQVINSQQMQEEVRTQLAPYLSGKVNKVMGVFSERNYRWGGNASAYMLIKGHLPEAKGVLDKAAQTLCNEQERSSDGLFHMPSGNRTDGSEGFCWIDTVFAVSPFLMWIGQATGNSSYIDEACFQMIKHHEVLFDNERKLYHQAINYNEPGVLTPAYWSRGCGWGAYALAELVCDLTESHKDYQKILGMYRDLLEGCLSHMDNSGMLHQAVETPSTYAETSGTGMVLYAMARGLDKGVLDKGKYSAIFKRGLKSMLGYLALDGSVYNCCPGCLAPNKGTAEDYGSLNWKLNDTHAFGPIILLFTMAQVLSDSGVIPELQMLSDK